MFAVTERRLLLFCLPLKSEEREPIRIRLGMRADACSVLSFWVLSFSRILSKKGEE